MAINKNDGKYVFLEPLFSILEELDVQAGLASTAIKDINLSEYPQNSTST